ncbi:MAG: SdpI family protein [Clostridia bacterium]|nr:SdpI family protein [Clostridia bacterium]
MKNNRKLYIILAAIILGSIVVSAVLLTFLPDTVPLHYDFNGNIDRYGSKYELLLFPGIMLLTGAIFLIVALKERKKEEKSNEKPILYTGIGTCLPFAALGVYLMAKNINNTELIKAESIMTFIGVFMGITLIILGNFMPKARMNSFFGLRTSWSMKNERVWQKSQRLGGIALVIGGVVTIILMMLVSGSWCIAVFMGVITAVLLVSMIGSYRYYKQDSERVDEQ